MKRTERAAAKERRQGLDPVSAGQRLTAHVMRELHFAAGTAVAGYWPIGDEIDIRPLLYALYHRGHPVLLPVTPARGEPLAFRRWQPEDRLVQDRFGTMRPTGAPGIPDSLLVPLLAFDSRGCRLGYGGGYYDRTLAGLPGRMRIGCAFAAQQVDAVPVDPYDMPLDVVATDQGIVRCGA